MAEVGYIFPEDAAKQVVAVGDAIKATDDRLLKYTEDAGKLIALLKQQNISFEQLQKVQKEATDTTVKLDAVGKQLIQSEEKLKQVSDKRTEQIIKNRVETAKVTQALKDKVKANQSEENSLVRMRVKLKELTEAYDKSGTRTKAAAEEINKLSREIGKAEAATNRHQRGVGGYADQLGTLPGPIGSATSGFMQMGKAMWALVANPIGAIIAALVVTLTSLYNIFKSTDEGATTFASVLKAMGNIVDVVIDRLVSFSKMLFDIVTFDFKGIKENAKDAFGGIGDALRDAAKAGWEYEQVMDRISDLESASLTRQAKLRKEIEELTVASKDRNLGAKEQIRLAELAMQKSKELSEIEVGYSKQKTKASLDDLASKISNNKLTNESKQKQLDEWLKIDDLELQSAIEKDKVFADFYNKNEDDFKNLQKLRSEDINKETELVTGTRRLQTSLFTFKKELSDESRKIAEDNAKAAKKSQEDAAKAWADEVWAKEKTRLEIEKSNEKYQDDFAKQIDDEQKLIDKQLDDEVSKTITTGKKIIDEKEKLEKEAAEKKKDDLKKQLEEEEEIRSAIEQAAFDSALMLTDELTNRRINNIQKEFDVLEMQKEAELSRANLTAEQKQQIEEKYAKEAAKLKTKQAEAEKRGAIFTALINTAAAVVKALPNIPLSIIAGAMGLLNVGLIASRPIPKFATGTDYAPHEFIAGEAGRELIKTKSGDLLMADKATHFKGNKFKGATVFTNRETEQIISESGKGNNFVFDTRELRDEMREVKNAIVRKPVSITDNSGRVIGKQEGNYRETYLNRMQNGR